MFYFNKELQQRSWQRPPAPALPVPPLEPPVPAHAPPQEGESVLRIGTRRTVLRPAGDMKSFERPPPAELMRLHLTQPGYFGVTLELRCGAG